MSKRKKSRAKGSLKQFKKRAARLFICVGLISSITLVGYGAWTARHILEPISSFASEFPTQEATISQDQIKFYTLTLDQNDFVTNASLTIIDTHEKTLKTISLPENALMHLPYGLDEFKLGSLYKIAALENSKELRKLVTQTLVEYFGVPSHTIYIIKNQSESNIPFVDWIVNPATLFHLAFDNNWVKDNVITESSSWDLLRLANTIRTIPKEFTDKIDLIEYDIAKIEKRKDGSEAAITDQNKLDAYIKKSFQNIDLIEEKANIQIENGTTISGLGSNYSRIVTNMGGIVIGVKNSEQASEATKIIVSDKRWESSVTVQELKNTLDKPEIMLDSSYNPTADISVILGDTYAKMSLGGDPVDSK